MNIPKYLSLYIYIYIYIIGENSTERHLAIMNLFQQATPYAKPTSSDNYHTIERKKNVKNILSMDSYSFKRNGIKNRVGTNSLNIIEFYLTINTFKPFTKHLLPLISTPITPDQ